MKLTPEEISWMDHYVLAIYTAPAGEDGIHIATESYYFDALEYVLERRRALKLIEDLPEEE